MWKSTELNYKVSIDQDPRGHMKKKRKKGRGFDLILQIARGNSRV
jgi:hypothetical protein